MLCFRFPKAVKWKQQMTQFENNYKSLTLIDESFKNMFEKVIFFFNGTKICIFRYAEIAQF